MKKNNLIAITLTCVLGLGLMTGCATKKVNETDSSAEPTLTEQKPQADITNKRETTVKADEIELVDFTLVSPNEYGESELQTKFKNNSKENITYVEYTYEMNGEKFYLTSFDTLLPGDTSTKEYTIVNGDNPEDLKLLSISYDINRDGKTTNVIYDAKLQSYNVSAEY